MPGVAAFAEIRGDGVRLRIRVTPNARREMIGGLHEDADGTCWLKASVHAVPEKGRANAALIALVSQITGIARSQISLESGETNRLKTLMLSGAGAREAGLLEELSGG